MPPMDMGRRWCAAAVDHGQIRMVVCRRSEILKVNSQNDEYNL